jgi:hypothetical protein
MTAIAGRGAPMPANPIPAGIPPVDTDPTDFPLTMTAQQAARLLHVRPSKVASWITTGQLRAADVSERPGHGRARWRITRGDLLAFLDGRTPSLPPERERRRKPNRGANWIEYVKR